MDDTTMLSMSSSIRPILESKRREELPEVVLSSLPEDYRTTYQARHNKAISERSLTEDKPLES